MIGFGTPGVSSHLLSPKEDVDGDLSLLAAGSEKHGIEEAQDPYFRDHKL